MGGCACPCSASRSPTINNPTIPCIVQVQAVVALTGGVAKDFFFFLLADSLWSACTMYRKLLLLLPLVLQASLLSSGSSQVLVLGLLTCHNFDVFEDTGCDAGSRVAETSTPDAEACCAACKANGLCRAWQWSNQSYSGAGANEDANCHLNTNPGTPSVSTGYTCGIAKDVPPGTTCTHCMDVYFNISVEAEAYHTFVTNTSSECCEACAADVGKCNSWQWTQMEFEDSNQWVNCALQSGSINHIRNGTLCS